MAVSFTKIALTLCVVIYGFCLRSLQAASQAGFSVELIHRDSPRSPFYDPSEAPTKRLHKALARTTSRAGRLGPAAGSGGDSPFSEIVSDTGSYLMNISIGTPPFEIVAIADTGSDLVWTQCRPCDDCYQQVAPLFDPEESSTYRDVSCTSSKCALLQSTSCDRSGSGQTCHYSYSYGDQSHTNGNIAVDTVTLASTSGRPVAFPQTLIGCGHDNAGTFDSKTSGIVGLGGGPVSLISQMGRSTGGKFSYCLIPFSGETDKSSQLNFGTRADVSGPGTVSTPFEQDESGTFYYLTLEAISVGETRIPVTGSQLPSASGGNIIIDSGTTLTLLPEDTSSQLATEVANHISQDPISDPPQPLQLCYSTTADIRVPPITAHFTGADVQLGPSNAFLKVSDDMVCLTFVPTSVGQAIYGNLAQMNFHIGYDLEEKTVSFKPTDCSQF